MKLNEMVALVRSLRGWMPETARSSMAHGICRQVKTTLDGESLSWWLLKGRVNFLMDCAIEENPMTTPDDITVPATKLAEFINRWRATTMYKDGDEWMPMTQEMVGLITTMTEELEDVAVEMPE